MKKIFLSVLLLFFSIEQSFAKEVRTRFGFYVDLPNNYMQLTANLDELLKKDKDNEINMDKEFFNEMMSGASRSDLNIEYFFPKKKYDPEKNMIYIIVQNSVTFDELLDFSLNEICQAMTENLSGLYKKKVKLYDCKFNPKSIDKKNSSGIYFVESDGSLLNQRLYMVILEMSDGGMTTFAAGCEIRHCNNFKKDLFAITNSRNE